jgi:hypothetical protein
VDLRAGLDTEIREKITFLCQRSNPGRQHLMKYKENNLSKNDINVLCSNIILRTINEHESQ